MSQPKRCQSCGESIGPSAKYCGACGAEQIEQPTQAWYTQTWVAVVALWLFFPLGLYLMWRFQRWQVWVKTVVTVVGSLFAILIIVGAAVGGGEDDDGEAVRQEASPSPAVEASPSPTVAASPSPTVEIPASTPEPIDTPEPTPEPTPQPTPPPAQPPTPEIPEYRVVTVKDISFGAYEFAGGDATAGAVRFDVRAVTEFPITKAQAQAVMDKIIDEIKQMDPDMREIAGALRSLERRGTVRLYDAPFMSILPAEETTSAVESSLSEITGSEAGEEKPR